MRRCLIRPSGARLSDVLMRADPPVYSGLSVEFHSLRDGTMRAGSASSTTRDLTVRR